MHATKNKSLSSAFIGRIFVTFHHSMILNTVHTFCHGSQTLACCISDKREACSPF